MECCHIQYCPRCYPSSTSCLYLKNGFMHRRLANKSCFGPSIYLVVEIFCNMGKPKQCSGYSKKPTFHGNRFVSKHREHRKESNADKSDSVVTPGPTTELDHSFTTTSSLDSSAFSPSNISSSKLEGIDNTFVSTPKMQFEVVEGCRFVDMRVLAEAIQALICPLCLKSCMRLYENSKLRKGLASLLYITCNCEF